jgi:SAM-dependent methyltransferase
MNGPTPLVEELLALAKASGLALPASAAVPGCGYGHDAAELASLGFDVTGVDFAPAAVAGARARYGEGVAWAVADWLHDPFPPFDLVFDHTCFVAFEPHQRADLVLAHSRRLRPGGLWLGAFFHTVPAPGVPPFAISEDEVRTLAAERFEVLHLGPATRSHRARAGREFLLVARLRPGGAPASGNEP